MDLSNDNIIHIKKDGIQYIQFRKLLEYTDIIKHAYSLGIDTNFRTAKRNKQGLNKADQEKAIKSYKNLCDANGMNYINVVKPIQEHTDEVKIVDRKINDNIPDFGLEEYSKTDGLITNKSNLILSTTNADCILLLFFDPVKKVIANVHSGWRGTLQRISIKTVEKMVQNFNCNPQDIICCICPSIRKCHFEVKSDVETVFRKEFQDLQKCMKDIIEEKEPGKTWYIDTVLINKILLKNFGLKEENIIDSGICSVCNSELVHSYRVEKEKYGLATALIMISGLEKKHFK